MATRVQFRRGTTAQTASFTGAAGEMTVDTTKNTLVVHDGTTAGGYPLAKESDLQGDVTFTGDLLPDMTGGTGNVSLHSLGSSTAMWQDVFIGPGSLYVDGQKVIESASGTIVVTADSDQNIQLKSQGTGDIEFLPDGSGIIQMKGTLSLQAGNNLTSSDANPIQVQVGLNMNGEAITGLAAPSSPNDAATMAYVQGLTGNSSNWDTAFGWGDHSAAGYAASSHTHTKAQITDFSDGDYATSAQGANADAAFGWGDHGAENYSAKDTANTFTTNQIIDTSSTDAALRVTQTGTGLALLVEDSANPDASPFYVDADGNVVIAGNLTVNGTQTIVNSTTVAISDQFMVLNKDQVSPTQDAGIEVERGSGTNKVFKWDETGDYWSIEGEQFRSGQHRIEAGNPALLFTDTDAASDDGRIWLNAGDGDLTIQALSDAGGGGGNTWSFVRSDGTNNFTQLIGREAGVAKITLNNSGTASFAGDVSTTGAVRAQRIDRDVNNGSFNVYGGNNSGANVELYGTTHATNAGQAYYDAFRHTFRVGASNPYNSTTAMQIRDSGEVLIGTTTDLGDYKLQVSGKTWLGDDLTMSGDVILSNNALVAATDQASNWDHIWHNDSTNTWHFCSDTTYKGTGNSKIQVGTVSASGEIDASRIDLTAGGTNVVSLQRQNTTSYNGIAWGTSGVQGNQYLLYQNNTSDADLSLQSRLDDGTIRSVFTHDRISNIFTFHTDVQVNGDLLPQTDNTGNVGTSSLTWNNGRFTNLQIDSTLTVRGAIDLADNDIIRMGSGDDAELFCTGTHLMLDLNSGINNFYIRDGETTRYTFNDNGNFTATGNVTAYSDVRLKENIETISNAVEKVAAIRGVTYNRKDVEMRQAGVIAQEVEEVLPEVVNEDEEGIKSVAYGNMVGLLIEAIKEQQDQINVLKMEIASLKGE